MRDLSTAQRGSESGNRPIRQLFGVNDRTAPGSDELLKGLGALDRPVDGTFGIHEQEGGSERSDEARRCSVRGVAIFGSFRLHRISMMSFARVQGIRTTKNFSFGKRLGSRCHWMLGRCYIGLKSSELRLFGASIETAFGKVALRSTLSEASSTAISGSPT